MKKNLNEKMIEACDFENEKDFNDRMCEILKFDENKKDILFFAIAYTDPYEGPIIVEVEKDKMMDFLMLFHEEGMTFSVLGYYD